MSTTDDMTHLNGTELDADPQLTLDLGLDEAEALRAWLLRASADGATALDDPLVNGVLSQLGRAVDAVRAVVSVRLELRQAGLDVTHLSDEEVRELGRRVSAAASPGIRA
jgi:hypothetical protein